MYGACSILNAHEHLCKPDDGVLGYTRRLEAGVAPHRKGIMAIRYRTGWMVGPFRQPYL